MSRNGPPYILLTGSPLRGSLDWNENALESTLLPAFASNEYTVSRDASISGPPAWRELPFKAPHLPTGLTPATQANVYFAGYPALSGVSASSALWEDSDESLSQVVASAEYYEHSFIQHDEQASSQLIEPGPSNSTSFINNDEETFFTSSDASSLDSDAVRVHAKLRSTFISDLADLPSSSYLSSINPQTMTVNLLVGIISISAPRTITTRRNGTQVDLVELTVGDETRSGFGLNIWLPIQAGQDSNNDRYQSRETDELRNRIGQLRPRDVILATRVALSSFREIVYGQSLRKGMTTIDALDEQDHPAGHILGGGALDEEGNIEEGRSEQDAKLERTREWVLRFVNGPRREEEYRKKGARRAHSAVDHLVSLPLDTQ